LQNRKVISVSAFFTRCKGWILIVDDVKGQKAIIARGFSESDRVRQAKRMGAGPHIKKPCLLEKIGLAVKAELRKK